MDVGCCASGHNERWLNHADVADEAEKERIAPLGA
jgi:hypothetical protein